MHDKRPKLSPLANLGSGTDSERHGGDGAGESWSTTAADGTIEDSPERKRVEAALRESEAQYRNLFQTMTQGVIYYNREGRITSANPAAGRILGLTLDQILGRTSRDPRWHTIHEDGSPFPGETQPAMVALRTGQPICDVLMGVFDPKEQQHRWVLVNAVPQFRTGEQYPFQVYATMADITERKQAEDELRRLSQAAAVAEERQRLARELHDSVTQALYSLSLIATGGKQAAQVGDRQLMQEILEQIDQTVKRALRDMRLLIYELRPTLLEQEGLAGALRQRLDLVEERAGVQTELLVEGQWELPPGIEIALYGIAQEALNNTLKHARATKITVQLTASPDRVTLEICDNGQGFDAQAAAARHGLGLTHLRERAEGIGGTLSLVSEPGEGTRVKVEVRPQASLPHLAV